MTGRRAKETRGQYVRCQARPCKRKAVRNGLCALHDALATPDRAAPAEPVIVTLTLAREVRYDRDGDEWRVAFYAPQGFGEHVKKLARRAEAGSASARRELDEIPVERVAARGADPYAIVRRVTFGKASEKEVDEIVRYMERRELAGV